MILQQLKSYLEQHGTTERAVLANHFGLTEDGVDAMLQVWVNKGKVTRMFDTIKGQEKGVRYTINQGISLNVQM
ncbi:FeoC-like transcriptional regulator [Vibrio comitans]